MNLQPNIPSIWRANAGANLIATTGQGVSTQTDAEPDVEMQGQTDTPLGTVRVRWRGRVLTRVELAPPVSAAALTAIPERTIPDWIGTPLQRYCHDPSFRFTLAVQPAGTLFQQRVWQLIAAIPAGQTRTYAQLAAELGSGPRAVGGACRANPYPLLVPCHRVVALNGLGGFAGDTEGRLLAFKRRLLVHEGALDAT